MANEIREIIPHKFFVSDKYDFYPCRITYIPNMFMHYSDKYFLGYKISVTLAKIMFIEKSINMMCNLLNYFY